MPKQTPSTNPTSKPDAHDCDHPDEFLRLDTPHQAALLAYITGKWKTGRMAYRRDSYGLKHVFEGSDGGFYVTNGQFKGAMLRAGFAPTNPRQKNWYFRMDAAHGCAGRIKRRGFGSDPCHHKPDALTGLCSYHAARNRCHLPLDAAVHPDRESYLAAKGG